MTNVKVSIDILEVGDGWKLSMFKVQFKSTFKQIHKSRYQTLN